MLQEHTIPLSFLKQGEKAVVMTLAGGCGFERRLRSMGIKEGKVICLDAKHHFSGPLVVDVNGRQITIGRGMAARITVQRKQ